MNRFLQAWLSLTVAVAVSAPVGASGASLADRISYVAAPSAYSAAIADRDGLLIVGQRGPADRQLSAIRIDAQGIPETTAPTAVLLPRPAALKDFANYPLNIVVHPKLPLVYVWQDIAVPPTETLAQRPALSEFDHLHLFRVENQQLKPVAAFCRGTEYGHGSSTGTIAIDPTGRRLFLPNLRDDAGAKAIGFFDLDQQGMPVPVPVPTPGNLDGYGLDKFEVKLRPQRLTIAVDGSPLVAATDRVVLLGVGGGVALWDTDNRRGALGYVYVPQTSGPCLIASDPSVDRVFGVASELGDALFSIVHAEGYLTLAPEVVRLGTAVHLRSAPVVLSGKQKRLAIGGINQLHLVPLSADGAISGPVESLPVRAPSLQALAYSAKHDRLYVAVEKVADKAPEKAIAKPAEKKP